MADHQQQMKKNAPKQQKNFGDFFNDQLDRKNVQHTTTNNEEDQKRTTDDNLNNNQIINNKENNKFREFEKIKNFEDSDLYKLNKQEITHKKDKKLCFLKFLHASKYVMKMLGNNDVYINDKDKIIINKRFIEKTVTYIVHNRTETVKFENIAEYIFKYGIRPSINQMENDKEIWNYVANVYHNRVLPPFKDCIILRYEELNNQSNKDKQDFKNHLFIYQTHLNDFNQELSKNKFADDRSLVKKKFFLFFQDKVDLKKSQQLIDKLYEFNCEYAIEDHYIHLIKLFMFAKELTIEVQNNFIKEIKNLKDLSQTRRDIVECIELGIKSIKCNNLCGIESKKFFAEILDVLAKVEH